VPVDVAVPRPAALPLPGGRDGATVRVNPLLTAEIKAPPGFFQRKWGPLGIGMLRNLSLVPPSAWQWVPVPAFLVEHPEAGPVLIDTGLHPSVAVNGRGNLGPFGIVQQMRMEEGWSVRDRLRERAIDLADVGVVVITHLHVDHVSAVEDLPDATFVVDGREWKAACEGGLLQGYRHQLFDHALDWRTLDFAAVGVDSFASFGWSYDLFGDGSVRVLSTPGHSAGHCSVLLRLSDNRELLVTGDAAYSLRTVRDDLLPMFCADVHLYRRSLGEIRRYMDLTPDAVVIAGHDAEEWSKLEPVYD
jgi:glyoxylase-like metal-dependent hydrolase (beta-lactamase superfamily II)